MEQEKLFWNSRLFANRARNIKSRKIQRNITYTSQQLWISSYWSSSFEIQIGYNFKINFFSVPYSIIYNSRYVGCWKKNKMDGFGRYKKTNKFGLLQTYEGNFRENDFNGLVRNIFVDYLKVDLQLVQLYDIWHW